MSQELLKHDIVLKYSSLWQDTIRDGEFTLTNTNRLVRYYDGCNGLKTGSTDKAGFCISATAKRGNMQLIAVIMGAKTRDERNAAARALLDYGFSNFALYERGREYLENASVMRGVSDFVSLYSEEISVVVPKDRLTKVELTYDIPQKLEAPVMSGDTVGKIKYFLDGEQIAVSNIVTDAYVPRINMWQVFTRILKRISAG
jgi:D-alanyl-D-alanine carboxypeptidase (penicillin-binding protein 5/6)